jgi:soluble lytic murein transglycosylase-like protein
MTVETNKLKKREKVMIGMLVVLSITTLATMLMAAMYYSKMASEINVVKSAQVTQYDDHVETRQFLLSTIDWETKRQKTILFMRDMVVEEWRRCGREPDYNKAYLIAEANMKESEKYPKMDPFLLLAMQWKESSFIDTIVSPMGAEGLMQIMPATGRLLAGFFGIQYSNTVLKNLNTSVRFGAKYLDVLFAQYDSTELVLAAYNGGFRQAYYYTSAKDKLAKETADYIPAIVNKNKDYINRFKTYRVDEKLIVK